MLEDPPFDAGSHEAEDSQGDPQVEVAVLDSRGHHQAAEEEHVAGGHVLAAHLLRGQHP